MTITILPRLQKYKDLDLNFTAHPITGDVSTLSGDAAVARSIRNLIFLNYGDKKFHPEIGSSVRAILFDNITPLTKSVLEDAIKEVIRNYEPRVKVRQVKANISEDNNGFDVQIFYTFKNTELPKVITLFLERIR